MMKNLPVEVSDEDIEEMFEYADKNGDGRLSYKEFKVNWLLKPVYLRLDMSSST